MTGRSPCPAHKAVWAGVTFQPSDAFKQVRVPQPSHAQPRSSSWCNRFASSSVSRGLRHLASVGKSPPLRLTSSRSRGRAYPGTATSIPPESCIPCNAQAASPPSGRATLAGRTIGEIRNPELVGRSALNCRLTRSSGRAPAASAMVVRTRLPRITPRKPGCFISRSAVQRAIAIRSRFICFQTLSAP